MQSLDTYRLVMSRSGYAVDRLHNVKKPARQRRAIQYH